MNERIFNFRTAVGEQKFWLTEHCPRCGHETHRYLIIADGTEGEEHTYFLGCDRCKTWVSGSDRE